MTAFEDEVRRGGNVAVACASRFLMRDDPVHTTLRALASDLESNQIDYAVVGGMALVAQGYLRTTVDVNILVTADGLDALHRALDGRGYLPPFDDSRNLRNTQTGARVEFLVSGQFPGDGKPKPIAFPDPSDVAEVIDGIRYVNLPTLINLKLASGMTHPGRLRDLADVQELIRTLRLPAEFAEKLHSSVRNKFDELRNAVDTADSE